ncbi:helix-turn-helix domain-containing protein [Bacillus sp. T33-2]|uniref:helix-turn-helix domain-containing protein n=1 Tax=Bacillus sp. T33-2 TaxID=2054168 RepID=UPI0015E0F592|nr:helix-turn-helix domain-containing protein [Bacillus sp. T33-2]
MNIKQKLQVWKNENPIRKYRKDSGLSQPDIAAIIGVSTYTVQRWEDGAVNPSGDNVTKLNELIDGFSDQWSKWKKGKPGL